MLLEIKRPYAAYNDPLYCSDFSTGAERLRLLPKVTQLLSTKPGSPECFHQYSVLSQEGLW